MKYREIKELTTKELKEILDEEQISYTKLKIAHTVSPLDNPMKIRETRKKVARLKTELRKRELNK
jgi:large subunit ribosomal protein L29